jgi:hypothetical protein
LPFFRYSWERMHQRIESSSLGVEGWARTSGNTGDMDLLKAGRLERCESSSRRKSKPRYSRWQTPGGGPEATQKSPPASSKTTLVSVLSWQGKSPSSRDCRLARSALQAMRSTILWASRRP